MRPRAISRSSFCSTRPFGREALLRAFTALIFFANLAPWPQRPRGLPQRWPAHDRSRGSLSAPLPKIVSRSTMVSFRTAVGSDTYRVAWPLHGGALRSVLASLIGDAVVLFFAPPFALYDTASAPEGAPGSPGSPPDGTERRRVERARENTAEDKSLIVCSPTETAAGTGTSTRARRDGAGTASARAAASEPAASGC